MTLLGPFATPFRSLVFSLGGAALAVLWYRTHWLVPCAIVAATWLIVGVSQYIATRQANTNPLRALKLLELRILGVSVVSAALAGLVIVVTVSFTLDEDVSDDLATSTKEMISAVGAALTAFIAAVTITPEGVDAYIGDVVRTVFRGAFITQGSPSKGQVLITLDKNKPGLGQQAIFAIDTSSDNNWIDWSRSNREERVKALNDYVRG